MNLIGLHEPKRSSLNYCTLENEGAMMEDSISAWAQLSWRQFYKKSLRGFHSFQEIRRGNATKQGPEVPSGCLQGCSVHRFREGSIKAVNAVAMRYDIRLRWSWSLRPVPRFHTHVMEKKRTVLGGVFSRRIVVHNMDSSNQADEEQVQQQAPADLATSAHLVALFFW